MPRDDRRGPRTHMGRWECEGKPEDAHFGIVDDALARIAQSTSPLAFQSTGVYDPRRVEEAAQGGGYDPRQAFQQQSSRQQGSMHREADFEDIHDEYNYNLAQELYGLRPAEQVEDGRFAFLLFPEDLAILRIEARRNLDIVKIETFRSQRGLYDSWDEIVSGR